MTHTVSIPWLHPDDLVEWSEICAWAIEQFGLPGDRFTWSPNNDAMNFIFRDSKDAIYFKLKWL